MKRFFAACGIAAGLFATADAAAVDYAEEFTRKIQAARAVAPLGMQASGGREQAFRRIQEAANAALREGKLAPGPNGILPSGNAGIIINVGDTQIRLIGGRVVGDLVEIASATRSGLP